MSTTKRTTKPAAAPVAFRDIPNPAPKTVPRIGYIPAGSVYDAQDKVKHGPFLTRRWFFEDSDGTVYNTSCLKKLLDDYVDNDLQDEALLLVLADIYREANPGTK